MRTVGGVRRDDHPVVFVEAGLVEYQEAWERQRELARGRVDGTVDDTVLLLQHPDVYTAGRRTQPTDLPVDVDDRGAVDRGGRITWHGPGQLVGYPIVALADPIDVIAWVRILEQVLIDTCHGLGLPDAGRVAGRSGVWLPARDGRPERKIAAIGIRIAKGVSMHGFALNCDPDLAAFDRIVPCGISDAGVTSLSVELGRRVGVAEVLPDVRRRLADALDGRLEVRGEPAAGALPEPPADHLRNGVDWRLDPALQRT